MYREALREASIKRWQKVESVLADVLNCSASDFNYMVNLVNGYCNAKWHLYALFGNKLKIETEVDAVMTVDEVTDLYKEFISNLRQKVGYYTFIYDIEWFLDSLAINDIVNNKITEDSIIQIHNYNGDKYRKEALGRLQEGMKPSKLMLKLVPKEHRDTVSQAYSVLVPKFKAKGKVVVSIDPLDLLFVSENGIRSCHSLDGCHRAGNFAYMLDEVTAVAYYYKSTKDWCYSSLILHNLPWKVWRQLVFIDIDNRSAVFQRHYPSYQDVPAAVARKLVAEALAAYHNVKANWWLKKSPVEDEHCRIRAGSGLPYIDPPREVIHLKEGGEYPDVRVGRTPKCIVCGDSMDYSDMLVCSYCDNTVTCYECGARIHKEDAYYDEDGYAYCEDCWNEIFAVCEHCEETVVREDAYEVNGYYYCESCFFDLFIECPHCGTIESVDYAYEGADGEYYCGDCFDELFVVCDNCDCVEYREDSITLADGETKFCAECADEWLVQCAECGEYFNNNPDEVVEVNCEVYCKECCEQLNIVEVA